MQFVNLGRSSLKVSRLGFAGSEGASLLDRRGHHRQQPWCERGALSDAGLSRERHDALVPVETFQAREAVRAFAKARDLHLL